MNEETVLESSRLHRRLGLVCLPPLCCSDELAVVVASVVGVQRALIEKMSRATSDPKILLQLNVGTLGSVQTYEKNHSSQ